MLISVLLIALSTAGALAAPQWPYQPVYGQPVLGPLPMDTQETAVILHHRQDANIPDPYQPVPLIGRSLAEEKIVGSENGPASLLSERKMNISEILVKYITEELRKGNLKADGTTEEDSGNSKYAEIVAMFFKDLLKIPLVFLHAFSDAIARLTDSHPAVLVTPVSVPITPEKVQSSPPASASGRAFPPSAASSFSADPASSGSQFLIPAAPVVQVAAPGQLPIAPGETAAAPPAPATPPSSGSQFLIPAVPEKPPMATASAPAAPPSSGSQFFIPAAPEKPPMASASAPAAPSSSGSEFIIPAAPGQPPMATASAPAPTSSGSEFLIPAAPGQPPMAKGETAAASSSLVIPVPAVEKSSA